MSISIEKHFHSIHKTILPNSFELTYDVNILHEMTKMFILYIYIYAKNGKLLKLLFKFTDFRSNDLSSENNVSLQGKIWNTIDRLLVL